MNLLDAALAYAHRGWAAFPIHGVVNGKCTCGREDCSSPGKHPLVRRGLAEATTDVDVIKGWWRLWPKANVAVATGSRSGIVVIDVDLPRALASLDALVHKLPPTLTALTGGGGRHYIYRAVSRHLRCTTARMPGIEAELPGIDVRADGGYIVAPPSIHSSGNIYSWLDLTVPIAKAPAWLKESRRPATIPAVAPASYSGDGSAYGLAVLRDELDRLRAAVVGTRNHQLNRSAFAVARVVAGGELAEEVAHHELLAVALATGLSEHESRRTIDSALAAGARSPRVAPHRLRAS